jgi:hypothetical protein
MDDEDATQPWRRAQSPLKIEDDSPDDHGEEKPRWPSKDDMKRLLRKGPPRPDRTLYFEELENFLDENDMFLAEWDADHPEEQPAVRKRATELRGSPSDADGSSLTDPEPRTAFAMTGPIESSTTLGIDAEARLSPAVHPSQTLPCTSSQPSRVPVPTFRTGASATSAFNRRPTYGLFPSSELPLPYRSLQSRPALSGRFDSSSAAANTASQSTLGGPFSSSRRGATQQATNPLAPPAQSTLQGLSSSPGPRATPRVSNPLASAQLTASQPTLGGLFSSPYAEDTPQATNPLAPRAQRTTGQVGTPGTTRGRGRQKQPVPPAGPLDIFVRDPDNQAWIELDGLDEATVKAMKDHLADLQLDDRYDKACARGSDEVNHSVPSCFACQVVERNRNECKFLLLPSGVFQACSKCISTGKQPCGRLIPHPREADTFAIGYSPLPASERQDIWPYLEYWVKYNPKMKEKRPGKKRK